jgi:cation:H+ antiporter
LTGVRHLRYPWEFCPLISKLIFGEGLPTWALLLEIVLGGAIVILAGSKLTKYADALTDRYGLSAGWVGLILLATVTSLPEVVAGGTAVWIGNPDLAFAAIYGSCSFNITIIVLLNALLGGGSVLRLTSSFGALLLGISLFGVVLVTQFGVSVESQLCEIFCALSIIVTYVACMRLTYRYEITRQSVTESHKPQTDREARGPLGLPIIVLSVILVLSAWWLARTGDVLGAHEIEMIGRPLGATFVGAGFIALSTSLPEIATGVAAARLGNLDLALGNIFGSNMFNIFTIPMFKAVSILRGDALLMAGPSFHVNLNIIAGLLPLILTAITVGGLTYRTQRRLLRRLGIDSFLIAVVYVCGMLLLVAAGNHTNGE